MFKRMFDGLRDLNRDERGATAVEYGFLVGAVAVSVISGWALAGGEVANTFATASNKMAAVGD